MGTLLLLSSGGLPSGQSACSSLCRLRPPQSPRRLQPLLMLYLSIRLFALANSNALLRLTSGLDVAVAAEKSCERGATPVRGTHCEFPFKSRRCTRTLTSSARADNWNHRERPRWRHRSALQRVNPTGSKICTEITEIFLLARSA